MATLNLAIRYLPQTAADLYVDDVYILRVQEKWLENQASFRTALRHGLSARESELTDELLADKGLNDARRTLKLVLQTGADMTVPVANHSLTFRNREERGGK